jgi:hypothetical protein
MAGCCCASRASSSPAAPPAAAATGSTRSPPAAPLTVSCNGSNNGSWAHRKATPAATRPAGAEPHTRPDRSMGSEQRNGDAGSAAAAAAAIRQPRCKVCTSPHRPQIDAMLQAGQTQASVRVQFNALLGHDYFTRNNLSLHARKHLTPTPPNDAFATALAARFALPADAADLSPHAVASAILRKRPRGTPPSPQRAHTKRPPRRRQRTRKPPAEHAPRSPPRIQSLLRRSPESRPRKGLRTDLRRVRTPARGI